MRPELWQPSVPLQLLPSRSPLQPEDPLRRVLPKVVVPEQLFALLVWPTVMPTHAFFAKQRPVSHPDHASQLSQHEVETATQCSNAKHGLQQIGQIQSVLLHAYLYNDLSGLNIGLKQYRFAQNRQLIGQPVH